MTNLRIPQLKNIEVTLQKLWQQLATSPYSTPTSAVELNSEEGCSSSFVTQIEDLHRKFKIQSKYISKYPYQGSSTRLKQWIGSRRCLERVVRPCIENEIPPDKIRYSLTHTNEISIAIATHLACQRSLCRCGIGIDVERSDRPIHKAAATLFIQPQEITSSGLNLLQTWVIKEACFKANTASESTIVADYFISSFIPSTGIGSVSCEKTKGILKFQLTESEGFTFCLAKSKC